MVSLYKQKSFSPDNHRIFLFEQKKRSLLLSLIFEGEIKCLLDNQMKSFQIYKGLDYSNIFSIDRKWSSYFDPIIDKILDTCSTDDQIRQMLNDYNISDCMWNWKNKTYHCQSDQYEWFFLLIEDNVEAVCITYHPKCSKFDQQSIIYVDFLAVAPWNRINKYSATRKYSSLGSILLSNCCIYSKTSLSYRYGFSLHSLPQALGYYIKLGMKDFGIDANKENLNYLEMDESSSHKLVAQYV